MFSEGPDYRTLAQMGKEFMKRVDMKGAEVEAYLAFSSFLTGIIVGELVVTEALRKVEPKDTAETPEKSSESR